MIETIIKNRIASELNVEVFLEKPSAKNESYVVFEKTSSGKRNRSWRLCASPIPSQGKLYFPCAALQLSFCRRTRYKVQKPTGKILVGF